MKEKIKIGQGGLTWWSPERRSNRYGAITLDDFNSENKQITTGSQIYLAEIEKLIGVKGKLIVAVTKTRQSTHIGDLFLGILPKTPNIGDMFVLGEGRLFIEPLDNNSHCVGVIPEDGRDELWLDVHKLYNVHEQDCNVYFEII